MSTAVLAGVRVLRARRGLVSLWLPVSLAFLLGSMLVGVLVGPADLSAVDVVRSLLAHAGVPGIRTHLSGVDETILWQIRMPRVVLGALVGAMLATAGASYQG
ncbi:MAG TPA: iron chelate uptake ABC transporter family permease subunit, partial [Gaiellaceae bacterium]|nr:iron chelate uptake ABC transporter family permease subunit [Gaiellaceae bacterium]